MFHKLSEIDWKKALSVLAAIGVFWTGIMSLTPDNVDKWVFGLLAGLVSAITYWMNASRN